MSAHREILVAAIERWLTDPESAVEYAEQVDGRWAVRMRQETREATTVWFAVGTRSITAEAYVIPAPVVDREEAFRQCLVRNARGWRCHFALDGEGAVVLVGRIAAAHVTSAELDLLLGEFYETIEVAFVPLVRAGFSREKST